MRKKTRNIIESIKIADPQLYAVLKFIVKLNLFAVPLYVVLLLDLRIVELQVFTADIVQSLAAFSGIETARSGLLISVPIEGGSWAAEIVWDCVGWKSLLLGFALIFATDFPRRNKIKGLLILPAVYVINFFRIWFMFFFVSTSGLEYYAIVHEILWSWGLLLTVILLWIVWMKKIGLPAGLISTP